MHHRWGTWVRGLLSALLLVAGVVLLAGAPGRAAAQAAGWEALAPVPGRYGAIFAPAGGTLLVGRVTRATPVPGSDGLVAGDLLRSDDGGQTWVAVPHPADLGAFTVAPADPRVMYAGGRDQLLRSDDGGATWALISDRPGSWKKLAVSPADGSTVYGVLVDAPAGLGDDRPCGCYAFLISHDAGLTWQETRRETRQGSRPDGLSPCGFDVEDLLPHGLDPRRIETIEGCQDPYSGPVPRTSLDEGRTTTPFTDPPTESPTQAWGAYMLIGGRGTDPNRWYVALYLDDGPFGVHREKLVRSDNDGATWATLLESDDSRASLEAGRPADQVLKIAYDPARPDDLYARVVHREPNNAPGASQAAYQITGRTVRASHDRGVTWADLGAPNGDSINDLSVVLDGRYLFATTNTGIYRLALGP